MSTSRVPQTPYMYERTCLNLGNDCATEVTVDAKGGVWEYTPGCGGYFETTFERLIVERQEQAAQLYKDIEALRAIQRKTAERIRNGKDGTR